MGRNDKKRHFFKCRFRTDFRELLGFDIVAFLESVNTSAGIDQLLLAREERVAVRADIHAKVILGGSRLEGGAASALNHGGLIVGMDSLLHYRFTSLTS